MKAATASSRPRHPQHAPASGQRGITLFSLMFWALFIGFGAYLVIRVFPTVNEYLTIQRTIETIARKKFTLDAQRLLAIIAAENIGVVVLGLPINMDGSEGPRCQSTRAFARNFGKLSPVPVVYWDERLSTAAVERMLIQADASRAKRAEVIDKLAAAWILQAALDSLR